MTHVAHFTYGWVNPFMGFGFALAGSFLGLTCMVHARRLESGRDRVRWLGFASLAIGGTGIWMMHFIAMIGFTVSDGEVRYDLDVTILSLAISILSVAFGVFVVGLGRPSTSKVLIGGPLTGLGVVSMHYTGMAAVNIAGTLHYDPIWVAASIAIAVIAATVALFFTIWVDTRRSHVFAALTMAIAVCGMHYTGMGAVKVTMDPDQQRAVTGVDPLLLLIPILILATAALIALIIGVLTERDEGPRAGESGPIRAMPEKPVDARTSMLWTDASATAEPDRRAEPGRVLAGAFQDRSGSTDSRPRAKDDERTWREDNINEF
ncbi:MHYT domain-containing protein [Stackebrandtia soli]|uniref:MHYT domain-containing protein n=1 Tax=Stackebrandtia soli TaxID=1892856 RepID=UPI0039EB627A